MSGLGEAADLQGVIQTNRFKPEEWEGNQPFCCPPNYPFILWIENQSPSTGILTYGFFRTRLREDPAPGGTPSSLLQLIRTCLRINNKNRNRRLRSNLAHHLDILVHLRSFVLSRTFGGVPVEIITTRKAYEDAIKSIKSGVDFDIDDGSVSLDHGWKAWVEVVAHTRKKTYFLCISNDRFGFNEAKMSVNQWKKTEAAYSAMYEKSHIAHACTYDNVKTLLSLLLINCTPKNFSDYPGIIQNSWIRLGFFFGHDLFDLMKKTVEESEWTDWAPFWRNEYYRLVRIMEKEGRKVPDLGGKGQASKGKSIG